MLACGSRTVNTAFLVIAPAPHIKKPLSGLNHNIHHHSKNRLMKSEFRLRRNQQQGFELRLRLSLSNRLYGPGRIYQPMQEGTMQKCRYIFALAPPEHNQTCLLLRWGNRASMPGLAINLHDSHRRYYYSVKTSYRTYLFFA